MTTAHLGGPKLWREERRDVAGVGLQVLVGGQGETVLLLHDYEYLNEWQPYQSVLAATFSLLAPSHPGFGASDLPTDFDSIDDLAYFYLDLLRETGPAHVVGMGIGGWIAAELAVRSCEQVKSLVLVDAVGIKVSDRETRDIADTFIINPKAFLSLAWSDPAAGEAAMKLPGLGALDDAELTTLLRNRQTAALLTWRPFMHNPKLAGRLHRIDAQTLVLWGEADRIVTPVYGRAYAELIPGAAFETIPSAGHYPYLEQPERFAAVVSSFLSERDR